MVLLTRCILDAKERDRGVVHDSVLTEHLIQADGLDGGEHHLADHLVVVELDTAEGDNQTTFANGAATPLGPAVLVEVGGVLLDILGGNARLPAGERLLKRNDAKRGVEAPLVIPILLKEYDVTVERVICRATDSHVLGFPRLRGVKHDQVALLALDGAVLHGGLNRRTDDLERLPAQLFGQTNEHIHSN